MKLDIWELLEYTYSNPDYLSDGYYSKFGRAMNNRFDQLKKRKDE